MRHIHSLLLVIVFAATNNSANAETQSINYVYPDDFPAFEQLFLQGKCKARFPAAYVYDISKQEWLSYEHALAIIPEAGELLNQQQCSITLSKSELANQLNLQWVSQERYALLFFDYPEQIFDVFYSQKPDKVARYEQLLSLLSSLDHIPRYHIKPPLKGLRSQFSN
ncbi:MAG: hypothetical protein LAT66_04130 [Alkalimonas sp.]|nr:hypothetical protein [Alkalimonas sp.]